MQVKVPSRFYKDHMDRSNEYQSLFNAVIKEVGNYVIADLDESQISELLNDAEYYADGVDYSELRGLQRSAKATVKALNK